MEKVNPWDQQRGESSQAFTAFRAYLDSPTPRTIVGAYRKSSGRPDAAQVPGAWSRWSANHDWVERARLWDTKLAQATQAGILKSAKSRGERMASGLDQAIESAYEAGLELIAQGRRYIAMPTTRTELTRPADDGSLALYTIEAANPKIHRYAGLMVRDGLMLVQTAYERVVAQHHDEDRNDPETGEASVSLARAASELDQFIAEHRAKILQIPDEPPGLDPDDPDEDLKAVGT
jgi:hypothetical protein